MTEFGLCIWFINVHRLYLCAWELGPNSCPTLLMGQLTAAFMRICSDDLKASRPTFLICPTKYPTHHLFDRKSLAVASISCPPQSCGPRSYANRQTK